MSNQSGLQGQPFRLTSDCVDQLWLYSNGHSWRYSGFTQSVDGWSGTWGGEILSKSLVKTILTWLISLGAPKASEKWNRNPCRRLERHTRWWAPSFQRLAKHRILAEFPPKKPYPEWGWFSKLLFKCAYRRSQQRRSTREQVSPVVLPQRVAPSRAYVGRWHWSLIRLPI